MEILTRLSLKRAAVIVLLAVALLIGGSVTATQLSTELLPNIDFPVLSVITVYPGAGPNDVAEGVTKLVEQQISGVAKLDSIQSTSAENLSVVIASFQYGADLNAAQKTIEDNLKTITLPANVQAPKVVKFDFNSLPVLQLSLTSSDGKMSSGDLAKIASDTIVPQLSKIDGVFSVDVSGANTKEVLVTLDAAKMRAAGLTVQQISGILQADNISFPSGTVIEANKSVPVRTTYQITSTQQLGDLVVGVKLPAGATGGAIPSGAGGAIPAGSGGVGGAIPSGATPLTGTTPAAFQPQPIKLSDVATITLTDAPGATIARTNGQPAVGIAVTKTRDGNTVQIAHKVHDALAGLSLPAGVKVETIQDQSTYIESSINELVKEGLIGALFAVLVILLFLRNIRTTLVTAISIPLSILLAFVLMGQFGLNLNIFSLGGLAIAVGRVVDDSIVVLENIYRHVQSGEDISEAAYTGTKEVASAITSSTLTTVAVFLPIGLVGGLIGEIFLPFALTVTFALLASLLIALTVIPVLARMFLRGKSIRPAERDTVIQRVYTPTLTWALRHRKLTLLIAVLLFVGSIALTAAIPTSFLPSQTDKVAIINIQPAAGGSPQSLNDKTTRIEQILSDPASQVDVYQTTISNAGNNSTAALQAVVEGGGSTNSLIQVRFNPAVNLDAKMAELRTKFGAIANGDKITIQPLNSGPAANQVQIVLTGNDQASLQQAGDMALKALSNVSGLANLSSDAQTARPELDVQVDPNKAILAGQTTVQIAGNIRQVLTGVTATQVKLGDNGQPIDVKLVFAPDTLNSVDKLKALPIGGAGSKLTLGDVATITSANGPVTVLRYNQKLTVNLTGDITAASTGPVQVEINKRLAATSFPAGVTQQLGGTFAQLGGGFSNLLFALPIAILLVYLVMVIVFGSLIDPFIILFALPLASIGAFPALFITNRPIDISALIGLLMLVGIVVTNAIVLVDLVKQLHDKGLKTNQALLQAGRTRVRPILMTAVATILALTPLAFSSSQGSLIAADLATVVIGGLLTSTLLTLVVVPVVYSLVDGLKRRVSGPRQVPRLVEAAPQVSAAGLAD